MLITPVTRTIEKVESEAGTRFRCFGPHNAHYFLSNGIFRPINVLAIAKDQVTTGKMTSDLRNSHVVSVGINKAASLEKLVGMRKDDCQDGREQLEFTLQSATYNNVPVTLNADYREKFNPLVDVIGNLRVYSDRHRTRLALPATNSVGSFRIVFKIHTVGLTATKEGNRFVFRNAKGEFRYALTEPKILKPDGNIYRFGDPEKGKYWFDNTVAHHLEDLGNGEYLYIKESTDLFREMPSAFLIDADTCYSDTNDAEIGWDGEKGDDWDDAHDAPTGTEISSGTTFQTKSSDVSYFQIKRIFLTFDTSGLSGTVTACTMYLYCTTFKGYHTTTSVQKGTHADTPTTADYDSFSGSEYVHGINISSTPAWYELAFNSTGCGDIDVDGDTKICGRNYSHDYLDDGPGGGFHTCSATFATYDYTDTTYDPYLSVTTASAFTPRIICVC